MTSKKREHRRKKSSESIKNLKSIQKTYKKPNKKAKARLREKLKTNVNDESVQQIKEPKIKDESVQQIKNEPNVNNEENSQGNNTAPSPKKIGKQKKAKVEVAENNTAKKQKQDKQSNPEDDPEKQARTIFVGNWPVKQSKEDLERLFKNYGKIESCRFRSWPVDDIRSPKKVTVIKKKFHEQRSSTNAYVVFKKEKYVAKALEANAMLYEGHHLKVTRATDKEIDPIKAVFIGNLPFAVEDEDLWNFFKDCGNISGVHVIRDKVTSLGRGFAYVNFQDSSSVELALKLDQTDFNGRSLRISRCNQNRNKVKKEKKTTNNNWKNAANRIAKKTGQVGPDKREPKKNFQGQKATEKKPFKKRFGNKRPNMNSKFKKFNRK